MAWYDVDIFKTNNNYKTFLNHFMKYLNAYWTWTFMYVPTLFWGHFKLETDLNWYVLKQCMYSQKTRMIIVKQNG